MMQAGVCLRQDTETTLPELPEQHRIREKEEELHGLESVHMAESETKCTAPRLNTLEPECVTANSRVSDLHHTEASLIKTETDLSPVNTEDLNTESQDFTDLGFVTHVYPDQIITETDDGDCIKTEKVSILPDIQCVQIESDVVKLESSDVLVSDLMNTELNGAVVKELGHTDPWQCVDEPHPNGKKSGKKQSDVESKKPYRCDLCEKSFSRKNNLHSHVQIHTGEKPYKCDQCERSFSRKTNLHSHAQIHSGEKPYKCGQCEKCFCLHKQLLRHAQIHTGEKPYKCEQCEKSFSDKSNLHRHKRIHTGEKPYTCDVCGKCFSLKAYLHSHERIHTHEKPYQCIQCEKCFSDMSNLHRHEQVHAGVKPYTCDECGKSFGLKTKLQTHKQIHSGNKPYKCNLCEKSFLWKSSLKSHQRIHTGEKPYKCPQCNKSFCHKTNLYSHQRIHTSRISIC